MFDTNQLEVLDQSYFNVIFVTDRDVTIQSKNTGHYWYMHCTEYPKKGNCIIFHKHRCSHPYHQHGKAGTLRQAVRNIKRHDKWQMKKEKVEK